MKAFDYLNIANSAYLERLYEQYLSDPRSLDDESKAFFAGYELADSSNVPAPIILEGEAAATLLPGKGVYGLVNAYRAMGHYIANLDPLGNNRQDHPLLKLTEYGLSVADYDHVVGSGGFLGPTDGTLRDLLDKLQKTYTGTLGVEYMEISDKTRRMWLQERLETNYSQPEFTAEECKWIFSRITVAECFEQFLQTKYLGHKRFSLEGGESLIPLLDTIVNTGSELGVEEFVMGMAHRGRLNVLAHILRKPYETIFNEFEGTALASTTSGDGDVKYHQGYSYEYFTEQGKRLHLSLTYNPSHLELVDPVIEGMVRAKQEHLGDRIRKRVVPIQIHGDAAFTGQGIVAETLSLSEINGYHTGGTIHIIINNNLGFTANPSETRFTTYPTDVAKVIGAPIFHVNADDPEMVVHTARLAMALRQEFKIDVIIDLWCYRKYGHNEADDPTFTQPLLYQKISKHPSVTEVYQQKLLESGKVSEEELNAIHADVLAQLDASFVAAHEFGPRQQKEFDRGLWNGFITPGSHWKEWVADTAVSLDLIKRVGERVTWIPPGFNIHPKLKRLVETRQLMIAGEEPIDWGCGEMLAFGTLLLEGTPVRLDGQDAQRGTFSHRHAAWSDIVTGERYFPLANLANDQPYFVVYNTMLSELAVLGFCYGIASADPRRLVIWEAQFGDFANGAQPVIDQFISSGESKWHRYCGLVLLLPHGYEGQGPEHSSARLERFLTLCAENNIQVAYPTSPAQIFHLLRMQMKRPFRKPLIVMSPKSLLRHKRAVSNLKDFTNGRFQFVIDDASIKDNTSVQRLILCTGKIYYDLLTGQEERNRQDVALVRVEQLYPFPLHELQGIMERYAHVKEVLWVQEEPQNMGAWNFMEPRIHKILPKHSAFSYLGRDEAASPAHGVHRVHQQEQREIVQRAFEL